MKTTPGFPIYDLGYLKNGSAFAMNVNGSGSAQTFQFAPALGTWFLSSIAVMLVDPGTTAPTSFGALAILTNGVKLEMKTKGITQEVKILKENIDLSLTFSKNKFATQVLDALDAPVGWFNRIDFFTGEIVFEEPIVLKANTGDYFKAIVQDDLTGLETFRMMYKAFRQIL